MKNWLTATTLTVLALVLAIHMLDHGNAKLRPIDRNVYLQQQLFELSSCVWHEA